MIRKARLEDIEEILRLLRQVLQIHFEGRPDIFKGGTTKHTYEGLADIISKDEFTIYVYANEDGSVAGYVLYTIEKVENSNNMHDRKTMYIDDLCVDEACRGKGVGRKLFEYVKELAKEYDCDAVTLNVWALNSDARAFYEKMGLEPLKTTMEYRL